MKMNIPTDSLINEVDSLFTLTTNYFLIQQSYDTNTQSHSNKWRLAILHNNMTGKNVTFFLYIAYVKPQGQYFLKSTFWGLSFNQCLPHEPITAVSHTVYAHVYPGPADRYAPDLHRGSGLWLPANWISHRECQRSSQGEWETEGDGEMEGGRECSSWWGKTQVGTAPS